MYVFTMFIDVGRDLHIMTSIIKNIIIVFIFV